jgi:hypothetical protein
MRGGYSAAIGMIVGILSALFVLAVAGNTAWKMEAGGRQAQIVVIPIFSLSLLMYSDGRGQGWSAVSLI